MNRRLLDVLVKFPVWVLVVLVIFAAVSRPFPVVAIPIALLIAGASVLVFRNDPWFPEQQPTPLPENQDSSTSPDRS